ncbi:glycogenin-1 [Lasiosphaeria hispida]|uniref:glycogenin glucosyltransferase n=1 Tax=Lasiosphaeria hispida TaxID=260671 RepID=A0AAJ0HPH1_9PEZI|nr:glycogenin-1 [Lasiosphaeria hispida]
MAVQGGEDVYASLLLTDTYLPGALVLAHSLRDAGTKKKLAILVTLDTVSAEVVTQLKAVYDYVIPVSRVRTERPANLYLMNRPDLHSAFTKINLWRQTQFRKIVYLDADVLAYRAPDELFDLPHAFSAAPDIGWPDIFNTGVMVLTPNLGEYYALKAMADRGISFDGADQGLLNMHFRNTYNRLSFTYNVTPSAHYQYVPAYKHFQSGINLVHFIGTDKPWLQGRDKSIGDTPFDEIAGRWWAVYDRYYRQEATLAQPERTASRTSKPQPAPPGPGLVQYFVKGEYQPKSRYIVPVGESSRSRSGSSHEQAQEHHHWAPQSHGSQPEHRPEPYQPPATLSWDAQRQPPPPDSKPEAENFPQMHYEMSSDPAPFVPPERYPTPPRGMWYEVPKEAPAPPREKPRAIFPWESHQPRPSRVFPYQEQPPSPVTETTDVASGEHNASIESWPQAEPSTIGSSTVEPRSEPQTPPTPTMHIPSDPWSSFPRSNAWDEVPEINRYVDAIQKHRKPRSQGPGMTLTGLGLIEPSWGKRGSRVTDFPSEDDRPSLPVTPAPIRRPKFWGGGPGLGLEGRDDDEQLPAAEGVPAQSDWVCVHGHRWTPADCLCDLTNILRYHKDPLAQLQKLAKQQSELLLRRLGEGGALSEEVIGTEGKEIPSRRLPFGSDDIKSPTHVASSPAVVSPKPVKPDIGHSPVHSLLAAEHEHERERETPRPATDFIAPPSYQGPGLLFEKGEDFPTTETPALPTEEERDVLET